MLFQQIAEIPNQDQRDSHEGFLEDMTIKLVFEVWVGQTKKKSQYSRWNEELLCQGAEKYNSIRRELWSEEESNQGWSGEKEFILICHMSNLILIHWVLKSQDIKKKDGIFRFAFLKSFWVAVWKREQAWWRGDSEVI